MKISWITDEYPYVDQTILSVMSIAAENCLSCEGITLPCGISVTLCGDDYIRNVNRTMRGIDKATDVLSFPAVSYPKGSHGGLCPELLQQEYDYDDEICFLGDLLISVPRLYEQAQEYGHSPYREAAFLLVHGLCHLFGYDHIEDSDRKEMRSMEDKILCQSGISREGVSGITDSALLELAREAMKRSYSPYSHFPVGAALLCADGRIFMGCNIENASFGLTNCAERTALFKAVSEGEKEFVAIAIAARHLAWPCGACRQVLNEFAPRIRVLVTDEENNIEEMTLPDLLPKCFGPNDL